MTVYDFVQDVMTQLRPFLRDGQMVEFDLVAEAFWPDGDAEEQTVLVGGDNRLKFTISMDAAILPTPRT